MSNKSDMSKMSDWQDSLAHVIRKNYRLDKHEEVDLEDWKPDRPDWAPSKSVVRDEILPIYKGQMLHYQSLLYAENQRSLLIVLQALDSAGKDGMIRHVFTGFNPQGCQVHPFQEPSSLEKDHDYLWRIVKALPSRGNVGIFNRSHYEDVTAARIYNTPVNDGCLPSYCLGKDLWKNRYEDINRFEEYLQRQGTEILKFFLYIDYDEQRERLLARIDEPEKNWKFKKSDVENRKRWKETIEIYEECLRETATPYAPWYIVPSNSKWYSRLVVAETVCEKLKEMDPKVPDMTSPDAQETLARYKEILLND